MWAPSYWTTSYWPGRYWTPGAVVVLIFEGERKAIEGLFASKFLATQVKYENVPFDPPDNVPWVALVILEGPGRRAHLSGNVPRRFVGIIHVDVYAPEDTGTKVARQHADTIADIFREIQVIVPGRGVLTMKAPWYQSLGVDDGWYHGVVTVPYDLYGFN